MFLRRLRENSQPIAMLFAIGLALTAQYFFTGEIYPSAQFQHLGLDHEL